MNKISLFLRIAVAFALLYPAVSAWFTPDSWIGYFPPFATSIVPIDGIVLLHLFGALEIALALWILSGVKIFWPSLATAALLFLIVGFNLSQMDILFRDLPIALAAIALALSAKTTSAATMFLQDADTERKRM